MGILRASPCRPDPRSPRCGLVQPGRRRAARISATDKEKTMSSNKPIDRIAIVGTGVIGASWAAYYLARGFKVIATDPAPNAEANLRKYVDEAWIALSKNGLAPSASRDRLS